MRPIKVISKKTGFKIIVGFEMHESEYRQYEDNYSGLCFGCGMETHDGVEPDARKYECFNCEEKKVYGVPEILIMGRLRII